jgi:hypothetical protein
VEIKGGKRSKRNEEKEQKRIEKKQTRTLQEKKKRKKTKKRKEPTRARQQGCKKTADHLQEQKKLNALFEAANLRVSNMI